MRNELDKRLQVEVYSAYLCFALASYFAHMDLSGFATWAQRQSQEELTHALRIHDHMLKSRELPRLEPIAPPPQHWGSPLKALTAVYEHERSLGEDYQTVLTLVRDERDFLTAPPILFFLGEQFTDEERVFKLLQRAKMVENDPAGMLQIDARLESAPTA